MTVPFQETPPRTPLRVLILEDSHEVATTLVETLRQGGYDPLFQRVDTAEDFSAELNLHPWDIVFSDHSIGHFNSIAALQMVRDRGLRMPFIVISGVVDEDVPQSILRAGANDFIPKGETTRLVSVVARELGLVKEREERWQMQEAFHQSEACFQLFYEQAPVAYQTLDRDGCLLDVNPAWMHLLGFRREEVVGRSFGSFMTREGGDLFRQNWGEMMKPGTLKKEYVLVSKHARHLNVIVCGQESYLIQGGCERTHWIWYERPLPHPPEQPPLHTSGELLEALRGMLPICMYCKKIRDPGGDWHQLEEYIQEHSQARFSHSICPDCFPKQFPDFVNQ